MTRIFPTLLCGTNENPGAWRVDQVLLIAFDLAIALAVTWAVLPVASAAPPSLPTLVASPQKVVFTKMEPCERRRVTVQLELREAQPGEQVKVKQVQASYPFVKTAVVGNMQLQVEVTLPADFVPTRNAELTIEMESSARSLPKLRLPLIVARVPREILATPSAIAPQSSLFRFPIASGFAASQRTFCP